jgi:4-amino-4-deoxy-L-arabinose transferase-like glycosyltransferase
VYICRALNLLNKIQAGWLVALVYTMFAIVLLLFMDGMFMDGVLYSAVSRNMALGNGTFWNPAFSQTMHTPFHEQPPFMLWFQSLFFTLFGTENIYPERIYCLLFLVLTVWAMTAFWKIITQDKTTTWWPVLLFLIIPTISWGFINNVMENTMSLFDILAVYFIYRYMSEDKKAMLLLPAVAFTFLASFSKGIPGLFPIAVPVLYSWSIERKTLSKKAFIGGALLLLSLIGIYYLLIQIPAAKESYVLYFKSRFPNFPNTPHSNTGNRLQLLQNLVQELAMPLGLIAFLAVANYLHKKPSYISKANNSKTLFFLLVALSASLPIMVSYEQRGFYLNTSMPYFAMAIALLFAPLTGAFEGINHKFLNAFKAVLVLAFAVGIGLTIVKAGQYKRDADRLSAIATLKKITPKGSIIYCNKSLWMDWSLHNYLQRFGEISLSQNEPVPYGLYIQLKTDKNPVPSTYMPHDKGCEWVDVYVVK